MMTFLKLIIGVITLLTVSTLGLWLQMLIGPMM